MCFNLRRPESGTECHQGPRDEILIGNGTARIAVWPDLRSQSLYFLPGISRAR